MAALGMLLCAGALAQSDQFAHEITSKEAYLEFGTAQALTGCESHVVVSETLTNSIITVDSGLCVEAQSFINNEPSEHVVWKRSFVAAEILDTLVEYASYDYIIRCFLHTEDGATIDSLSVDVPLSFSNTPTELHNDRSVVELSKGYDVVRLYQFEVMDASTLSGVGSFTKNFMLRLYTREEIYDTIAPSTLSMSITASATGNKDMVMAWSGSTVPQPSWYQLEWLFLDTTASLPSSPTDSMMREGATRIITDAATYTLTNHFAYPGKLYARVRLVRPFFAANTVYPLRKTYGPWYTATKDISSAELAIPNTLNWSYEAGYIENGKRKETLSYFDGTGKHRQSLAFMTSYPDMVVGTEQFYDHAGNAAINVLPAPEAIASDECKLDFRETFNEFDTTIWTIHTLYDSLGIYPRKMDTASGAARYYSDQNDWLGEDDMADYIPDAEGYPYGYTQVDGIGRTLFQNTPGNTYRLDTTLADQHFTKVLYAQPSQTDLDMYLGNHARSASQYEEVITEDANGQKSIAYIDHKGRTVMTCIMDGPSRLRPIDTKPEPIFTVDNELEDGGLNVSSPATNPTEISYQRDKFITGGEVFIDYEVFKPYLTVCDTLCYECLYDASFSILDRQGNSLVSWTSDPFTLDSAGLDSIGSCTDSVVINMDDISGTLDFGLAYDTATVKGHFGYTFTLDPGVYYFDKTLALVSDSSIAVLASDYVTQATASGCLKDEFHFVDSTTSEPYDCEVIFSDELNNPCTDLREDMLEDMVPEEGKYAAWMSGLDALDTFSLFRATLNQVTYGSNLVTNGDFEDADSTLGVTSSFLHCDGPCDECVPAIDPDYDARFVVCGTPQLEHDSVAAGPVLRENHPNPQNYFFTIVPNEKLVNDTLGLESSFFNQNLSDTSLSNDTVSQQSIVWAQKLSGLTAGQEYQFDMEAWNMLLPGYFKPSKLKIYVDDVLLGNVLITDSTSVYTPSFTYTEAIGGDRWLRVDVDLSCCHTSPAYTALGFALDNITFRTKHGACDCVDAFGLPNPDPNYVYGGSVVYPYQCLMQAFHNNITTASGANPAQLGINGFIANYDESWLPYMLQVHPEYCNLLACEEIQTYASGQFIRKLDEYTWEQITAEFDSLYFDSAGTEGGLDGIYASDPLFSGIGSFSSPSLQTIKASFEQRLSEYYAFGGADTLTLSQMSMFLTYSGAAFFDDTSGTGVLDQNTLNQWLGWVTHAGFNASGFGEAFWTNYRRLYLLARQQATQTYYQGCLGCGIGELISTPSLADRQTYLQQQLDSLYASVNLDSLQTNPDSAQALYCAKNGQAYEDLRSQCEAFIYNRILTTFPVVEGTDKIGGMDTTVFFVKFDNNGGGIDSTDITAWELALALSDECACGASMDSVGTYEICEDSTITSSHGILDQFHALLDGLDTARLQFNPWALWVTQPYETMLVVQNNFETQLPTSFNPPTQAPGYGNMLSSLPGSITTLSIPANGLEFTVLDATGLGSGLSFPLTPLTGTISFDRDMIAQAMYADAYPTAYHFFTIRATYGSNPDTVDLRGFYRPEPVYTQDLSYANFSLEQPGTESRLYCQELEAVLQTLLNDSMMEQYHDQPFYDTLTAVPMELHPAFWPTMKGFVYEAHGWYLPETHIHDAIAACRLLDDPAIEALVDTAVHLRDTNLLNLHPQCADSTLFPTCEECNAFYDSLFVYIDTISSPAQMDESSLSTYLSGLNYGFNANPWEFHYPEWIDGTTWNHYIAFRPSTYNTPLLAALNDYLDDYNIPDPTVPQNDTIVYSGPASSTYPIPGGSYTAVSGLDTASLFYKLRGDNNDQYKFWIDNNANGRVWIHLAYKGSDVFHDVWLDYRHFNGNFELTDIDSITYIKPMVEEGDVYHFMAGIRDSSGSVFEVRGQASFPIGQMCNLPAVSLYPQPGNTRYLWATNCEEDTYNDRFDEGVRLYQEYILGQQQQFAADYRSTCINNVDEALWFGRDNGRYHYTLYLFDRADNLITTVPPSGVVPYTEYVNGRLEPHAAAMTSTANYRNNSQSIFIDPFAANAFHDGHTMRTTYAYNSLNEVVHQETPDGGISRFHYDRVGRIAFSQNSEQRINKEYAYTLYDPLSRITESGQICPLLRFTRTEVVTDTYQLTVAFDSAGSWVSFPFSDSLLMAQTTDFSPFDSLRKVDFDVLTYTFHRLSEPQWHRLVDNFARQHVVRTTYDEPSGYGWADHHTGVETNLRNRTSGMYKYDVFRSGDEDNFDNSMVYHYDATGNVKTLIREFQYHGFQIYKTMHYEYDQVSGNVNAFRYQPGQNDELYHRYAYDEENRLTLVESSRNNEIWDRDASYTYYRHGPLESVQLGQRYLQSMEYAYDLNGWLQLINGVNDIGPLDDPSIIPADVYGLQLHYQENDFTPIGSAFGLISSDLDGVDLYNGNIPGLSQKLQHQALSDEYTTVGRHFHYDQLNRIKDFTEYDLSHDLDEWTDTLTGIYTAYTYDGNGNIQTLERTGLNEQGNAELMDDLGYAYQGGTNRLRDVCESVEPTAFLDDIDPLDGAYITRYAHPVSKTVPGGASPTTIHTCMCVDLGNWPPNLYYGCNSTQAPDFLENYTPADSTEAWFDLSTACRIDTVLLDIEHPESCSEDNPEPSYFVVATVVTGGPTYVYDSIGNLVSDINEGVNIEWNPIHKVEEVDIFNQEFSDFYASTGMPELPQDYPDPDAFHTEYESFKYSTTHFGDILFDYDPMGERIAKEANMKEAATYMYYDNGTIRNSYEFLLGKSLQPLEKPTTEYYVRDAQGSIIAMYRVDTSLTEKDTFYFQTLHNLSEYLGLTTTTDLFPDVLQPMMAANYRFVQTIIALSGHRNSDALDSIGYNAIFDQDPTVMSALVLALPDSHGVGFYNDQPTIVKNAVRQTQTWKDYARSWSADSAIAIRQWEYDLHQSQGAQLTNNAEDALAAWDSCLDVQACTDMQSCVDCEYTRIADPYDPAYDDCLADPPCSTAPACTACDQLFAEYDTLAHLLTFDDRLQTTEDSIYNLMLNNSLGLLDEHFEDDNNDPINLVIQTIASSAITSLDSFRSYLDDYYATHDWQSEVIPLVDEDAVIHYFFVDSLSADYYGAIVGPANTNSIDSAAMVLGHPASTVLHEEVLDDIGSLWGAWVPRWILGDPDHAPGMGPTGIEPDYDGDTPWGDLPYDPYLLLAYDLKPLEYYVYGSSRLGSIKHYTARTADTLTNTAGHRRYEVTDHLGNVHATLSDRKLVGNGDRVVRNYTFNNGIEDWDIAGSLPKSLVTEDGWLKATASSYFASMGIRVSCDSGQTYRFECDVRLDTLPWALLQAYGNLGGAYQTLSSQYIFSDGHYTAEFTTIDTAFVIWIVREINDGKPYTWYADNCKLTLLDGPTYHTDLIASMDYYPFGAPMPQRWQDVEPYDTVTNNSLDSNLLSTWTLMNEQKPTATGALDTTLVSGSGWSAYARLLYSEQVLDSPDKTYTAAHTASEPQWSMGGGGIEMMLFGDGYESYRINYQLDTNTLPGLETGDSIAISFRVAFNNYDNVRKILVEDASGGGTPSISQSFTLSDVGDGVYQTVNLVFLAPSQKVNIGITCHYSQTSGAGSTTGWHKNYIVMKSWRLQHYKAEEFGEIVVNSNTFLKKPHYRFGFQGQESDDEIKGVGNSWNYTFRIHDPRLGRFLSIDPLSPKYPFNSPYAFSENRVIDAVELEGLEQFDVDLLSSNVARVTLVNANDNNLRVNYRAFGTVLTYNFFLHPELQTQFGASSIDGRNLLDGAGTVLNGVTGDRTSVYTLAGDGRGGGDVNQYSARFGISGIVNTSRLKDRYTKLAQITTGMTAQHSADTRLPGDHHIETFDHGLVPVAIPMYADGTLNTTDDLDFSSSLALDRIIAGLNASADNISSITINAQVVQPDGGTGFSQNAYDNVASYLRNNGLDSNIEITKGVIGKASSPDDYLYKGYSTSIVAD